MFLLQPFCELKHFRDCVFIPLIKGGILPLVKGMNRISFGMDDAEEKWWPNKPLEKSSPAWMWKLQRQHLAKGEKRNKAGKKKGSGTTSQARKLVRQNQQGGGGGGGGNDGDDGGDCWERDWYWNNSWERDWGRWGSHTWASWNNWDDWEEDWHRSPKQSPRTRSHSRRSRRQSRSRDSRASPLRKGRSCRHSRSWSRERSFSPDWSRSATPSRKVWRIKEMPVPEAPDEEGPPLGKGDVEMEKEAPLEKGMDDKVGEVEMKEEEPMEKEGAQGGVQMKEETPLEKGEDDLMKGTPSTPLKKGYFQPMSLFPKPGEGLSMRQEVEKKKKEEDHGGLPQHPPSMTTSARKVLMPWSHSWKRVMK